MNTAVLIATISITLMNFGSPVGRIAGLIMSPVAVFFIGYSFWVYLRRARALERKEPINYNDKLGPTVLVITLMCALSVVILLNILYGGEEPPTTSTVPESPPELNHPVSHTKNHSKYARPAPEVVASSSPESQDENEDTYDEANLESPSVASFTHPPVHPSHKSSKKSLPRGESPFFYRSPAVDSYPSYNTPHQEQHIPEAQPYTSLEDSMQSTMLTMVGNNSLKIRGNFAEQPVDYLTNSKVPPGIGNGRRVDTADTAAALDDSTVLQAEKIHHPGLRSRTKMMKIAVGQKDLPSSGSFNTSGLQMEFEAAGHMPTH